MTATTTKETARQLRIDGIRNGAIVRGALGIDAGYLLLPDGRHQVTIIDCAARRVLTFTGDTLEEAIEKAREGRP